MSDINSLGTAKVTPVSPDRAVDSQQAPVERQALPAGGNEVPPQQREPQREQLEAAVTQIADYVQNISRELQFSLDEDSGRTVMKVLDSDSQELVRQIPSEEMLVLARKIRQLTPETAKGLLLQGEV